MGQTCLEICSAVVEDAQLLLFDTSRILRLYGQNLDMLVACGA